MDFEAQASKPGFFKKAVARDRAVAGLHTQQSRFSFRWWAATPPQSPRSIYAQEKPLLKPTIRAD